MNKVKAKGRGTSKHSVYLNALGLCNALGNSRKQIADNFEACVSPGMGEIHFPISDKKYYVGQVKCDLPTIPEKFAKFDCRNSQILLAAALQIDSEIKSAVKNYGNARVAVVIGSSTSGVAETERAVETFNHSGEMPKSYNYLQQEIGSCAAFLAEYYGAKGPNYSISTACSSSGKVLASARGLLQLGVVDAVIVGGADSLCEMTVNGFSALEATSPTLCSPFSKNRQGINIGEAVAVFIMTREEYGVELCGVGESADAHHISAPEPNGMGASQAMEAALNDAELEPQQIGYLNLHGTATKLNDSMESKAVYRIFGDQVPCSSTKALTGHTLGAAGITEAAFCWMILSEFNGKKIPMHNYDGLMDSEIEPIKLAGNTAVSEKVKYCMSNSFAFGGNNVSVILGSCQDD